MRNLTTHSICLALGLSLLGVLSFAAAPPEIHYKVSWVGNSFSGKDAWVLQDVEGICVLPDGTLFTNVFWDEAGGNVSEYQDGKFLGAAGHSHGWGYEGGSAVTANSRYLYIATNVDCEGGGLKGNSWPAKGFTWSGVSRRPRTNIRQAAPFEGGHGKEGDVLKGCFLMVAEIPDGKSGRVRGLCATEDRLYVSSPFDDTVRVYDAETMGPLATWHVDRPDRICLDKTGKLWVLQHPIAAEGWKALCLGTNGAMTLQQIQFPVGVAPTAIGIDGENRLLVADAGPDQQIKAYDHLGTSPHLAGSFGVRGGIFARPAGVFGDARFNRPTGVGVDAAGNLYVASSGSVCGGSTVLECYGPDRKLRWRRFGLTFVDLGEVDPQSPSDVFTKERHFVINASRPPGADWSYRGYTVNGLKYPDDPRTHLGGTNGFIRILGGRRFLFVTDMTGEFLHVYRFHPTTDGEIAIPCGLFSKRHVTGRGDYPPHQPEKGEWIWLDRNGNGSLDAGEYLLNGGVDSSGIFTPDERGAIWQANGNTIRALPLQGIDSHGAPIWDYARAKTYPRPAELDEVRRLRYLPDQDVMILGGNRGQDRNQHWKPMGPVLCVYDRWSTGTPKLRQQVVLPYEKGSGGNESIEPISFDVAGDFLFVAYTRGLKSEGLKNAFVKVLRLSDLSLVGNLSAEADLGETGLLDLVESVSARRKPDGEIIVLLEDDYRSKMILFCWKPEGH